MSRWTDAAKAKLEAYLARMPQCVAASGADVSEVADDLRRHVDEEIAARKLMIVTEQDIAQILAQIGLPEAAALADHPPAAPSTPSVQLKGGFTKKLTAAALLFFGVILPLGTVVFEYLTGACAGALFDPIPTFGHILLVTLVPLVNLAVWIAVYRREHRWRTALGWANGFAIGVAWVYAALFVPVMPFAAIGIVVYGFGLVPLAPFFSLICAMALRHYLRRAAPEETALPGLWGGQALGVAALVILTLPMIITQSGLQMAVSDSPQESLRGIRWLRRWGQNEELLRACYGRGGRGGEMYSWGKRINPEAARTVYYRVSGQPFNAVPPPKLYAARARWNLAEREFTWDEDQAGDAVAGRVRGLSLLNSRQDGIIYPDAALAYVEWTLEFQNDSGLQREARAQVVLPPGGVVSRLTLWIDGEEREAAFGGRSQVKTAYKEVVTKRRDPVLVTTCGPDRVLVQCFPVPPNGGKMKVRLGITAPLVLTAADSGWQRWPCFAERNFSIREQLTHSVWAESSQPMESAGGKLKAQPGKPGVFALQGQLREADLASPLNSVRARRSPAAVKAWTKETREDDGSIIRQAIIQQPVTPPDRVVLVVDGTRGMEAFYPVINSALAHLPTNIDFAVLWARDGCEELVPLQKGSAEVYERNVLRNVQSAGGHDNTSALTRAWELAAQTNAGTIVWVHGPQPVALDSVEELRQRYERSSKPPTLIEVQTVPGPNRVLERLDGLSSVHSLVRMGVLDDDLALLFTSWTNKAGRLKAVRERVSSTTPDAHPEGAETSMHLARLWAADEVARLCAARKTPEATQVAARYRLVTPVSGAVVLETQFQYERAGLQPAPAEKVPVVPEPSTTALVVLGLICVAARYRPSRAAKTKLS
jgi:hypothetical protein